MRPSPKVPIEYMQVCKYPAPLKSGSHEDVEVWALTTVRDASDCARMHGKLVDAVQLREENYK